MHYIEANERLAYIQKCILEKKIIYLNNLENDDKIFAIIISLLPIDVKKQYISENQIQFDRLCYIEVHTIFNSIENEHERKQFVLNYVKDVGTLCKAMRYLDENERLFFIDQCLLEKRLPQEYILSTFDFENIVNNLPINVRLEYIYRHQYALKDDDSIKRIANLIHDDQEKQQFLSNMMGVTKTFSIKR